MFSRRQFLVTSAQAGLVTASGVVLSGCGGGGKNDSAPTTGATVTTGFNGRLANIVVSPQPGGVFIRRSTAFQLDWPIGDPPRQFTVFLRRFLEPRGGLGFEQPTQPIEIEQVADRKWSVQRQRGVDLDPQAVYFLEILASGDAQRFVYIVSGDRSRAVTENPGTDGFLWDLEMSPSTGTYGIPRGIGAQGFEIRWRKSAPPPPRFTIRLQRYKEPRGDEGRSDEEQPITVEDVETASEFIYIVRRQGGAELDPFATYYLEARYDLFDYRSAYTTL